MDRDEAIKRIRAALKRRSGKAWSVTGGRGTSWGWIHIDAPPARQKWHYDGETPVFDPSKPFGYTGPDDRAELGELLGLGKPSGRQGESIPASNEYRQEYVDRAEGREPAVRGTQYWD